MGCASGMPRMLGEGINKETIKQVREYCKEGYPLATGGTFPELRKNKSAIVQQSRNCAIQANLLADMAENRNNGIKELK